MVQFQQDIHMKATTRESAIKSEIKSLGSGNKWETKFQLKTDNVVYGSAKVWLRKQSPVDRQYNVEIKNGWGRASKLYYCVGFEIACKLVTRHIGAGATAPAELG